MASTFDCEMGDYYQNTRRMGVQVFIIQLMALSEEIKYHNEAPWSVMIRKERPLFFSF